jgi:gamma-glutamyltranspeptidase/glutathione hydrolase
MPFFQAVAGGRAVGVPGALRMLELAHRRHGKLPWAWLFEPAITLAERGFGVGHRLNLQLASAPLLKRDAQALHYFYQADGQPWPEGHQLHNPALAEVLRRIAAQGSAALHQGPVAADIVARVQGHAANPGRLSAADLVGYQPKRREPICTLWRARWRVCGFPPPSSGHLAIMQILKLLDAADAPAAPLAAGVPSAAWLHTYAEASRLAFADRAQYVADPDFVPAPAGRWSSLLDDAYLRQRATLIGPQRRPLVGPGSPGDAPLAGAPQPAQPEYGTSHVSIVDGEGRALALTTSIEFVFGAQLMSDGGTGLPGGFLLNNQLTDFAFTPADAQGRPVANRVQPGKRPRSSMSPTLVFDARDGRLLMSLGSPGGPVIIHFVAKTLLGTLAWGLDAQRAIDLPNLGSFGGPLLLEAGRFSAATVQAMQALGHTVTETELPSGLQAIERTATGWFGGADARREGVVRGD